MAKILRFISGEEETPETIVGEITDPEEALVATDMDDTMTNGDIGLLVFIYELLDGDFWHLAPTDFDSILLSTIYEKRIQKIAKKSDHPKRQQADLIFRLRNDLSRLYRAKKALIDAKIEEEHKEPLDQITREFAAKMLAFDRLMMELEGTFISEMNGQLLMRIRFLIGKTQANIDAKMLEIKSSSHPETLDLTNWGKDEKRNVEEVELSPKDKVASTRLKINRQVKEILKIARSKGAAIRVVSTNKAGIVQALVENTPYRNFIHVPHRRHAATNLQTERGVYNDRTNDTPVFGKEKARKVKELERKPGSRTRRPRKCLLALGDSITNDGPMLRYALENGGIACIIIHDPSKVEETKARIQNEILAGLPEDAANRVFLIIDPESETIHSST